MKRVTDKLIAIQFLAVVLPIAVVLLVQMVVDAHRAEVLEYSRPFKILSAEARANYKIFTNGVADAAVSGVIGPQSVEALQTAQIQLNALNTLGGNSESVADASTLVTELTSGIAKGATLSTITTWRASIERGDVLTKAIDEDFERRDDFVVKDALASAIRQRRAVIGALVISTALSVVFVLATRRRLKDRMDAEIAAERQRRTESRRCPCGSASRPARHAPGSTRSEKTAGICGGATTCTSCTRGRRRNSAPRSHPGSS